MLTRAHVKHVVVPETKIPVVREVDVLVCGGGPAGVAAAVSAARLGARTLVVERHGFFGGMATAANVAIWHKLYGMDHETQVIHGLPQEIIERLEGYGAVRNLRSDGRGDFSIETEYVKLIYDALIREAGVEPLLHTWISDVIREGDRIDAVIVENKSGRQAIMAPVVIDATGDADIFARSGLPYQKGNAEGLMQPPSLCFRLGGIDTDVASESFRSGLVSKAVNKPMDYNGQEYPNFLWTTRSTLRPDEVMLAGVRVTEVDATDGWSFTRAEMEGRQQMEWVIAQLRNVPGFEKCHIVDIASQIGVRETRRIYGEHILQEHEVLEGIRFPDAIAQGTYPVDIHNPLRRGIVFKEIDGTTREVLEDGSTVHGFWTEDGQKRDTVCYQVPYRSLVPKGIDNALAAGRCISATHEAAGAARVMMNCMQFGQAAGVAAALSAQNGTRPREIDPALLRTTLEGQGCRFLT